MGAHRYWRMNLIAPNFAGNAFSFAELQLWDSGGTLRAGSTAGNPGTPSATETYSTQYPSNAFDNNTATQWGGNNLTLPQYFEYDFGVGVAWDITKVVIISNNNQANQTPVTWNWQYSDDNSTWYDYFYVLGSDSWGLTETRTYIRGTGAGAYRRWRLNLFTVGSTGNAFSFSELGFCTTAGGANAAIGGVAAATQTSGSNSPANAFDGNTATEWSSTNTTLPQVFTYDMGSGFTLNVAEVYITSNNNNAKQAPITFNVDYCSDGVTWTTLYSVSTPDTWTTVETRRFTAPSTGETSTIAQTLKLINQAAALNDGTNHINQTLKLINQAGALTHTAPNELATISQTLLKISQVGQLYDPGAPGTGLRQFWTFQ
jgi:hypothetical protein